jgi:uncharacterized protein YPO0396
VTAENPEVYLPTFEQRSKAEEFYGDLERQVDEARAHYRMSNSERCESAMREARRSLEEGLEPNRTGTKLLEDAIDKHLQYSDETDTGAVSVLEDSPNELPEDLDRLRKDLRVLRDNMFYDDGVDAEGLGR